MNITVLNGTEIKGCTYQIKNEFLSPLREKHTITEFFFPKDMPQPCCGCKVCFYEDAALCPHAEQVMPIWNALMEADLIVVATPIYGLGIPAGLKALLDHFCVRWMVHRPEPIMFCKRAMVITNCIGPPFMAKSSQRDIVNALSWMGISKIERFGFGLREGVIWNELSEKRRTNIVKKARRIGNKYLIIRPAGKSIKTRLKFMACKFMQKKILKNSKTITADSSYWIERGWIK